LIPFANFEPDRAPYAAGASATIVNAIPVADGWGPIRALFALTDPLPSAPKGGVRVRTPDGVVRVFAGTVDALYELDADGSTWNEVSGPSTYAVPDGDEWCFTLFGDNLVASNLGTDHQYIGVASGTAFADVPGSPPKSKYTWTAGEYFCLGNIASSPSRVMTSGIGDLGYWTVGQRGCDYQDFPDGGEVMGGIGVDNGAIVFQRTRLRTMNVAMVGDYSFTTSILNPSRGTIAPKSICQIGPGQFFYYSGDGFMVGAEGKPIGAERVDRWFGSDVISPDAVSQVTSVADPFNKIVWTIYQGGNRFLLGYNWQLDRWCYADVTVTGLCSMAMPTRTWDSLTGTIDEQTQTFDASPGNLDRFAAFDDQYRLCFFSGANMAATLETADVELTPGRRSWLQELRMLGECNEFTLQSGTMAQRGNVPSFGTPVSPHESTGICHFRSPGRIHRVRMNIPSGAIWRVMTGVEPLYVPEGRR
jgi:hypothetical protein